MHKAKIQINSKQAKKLPKMVYNIPNILALYFGENFMKIAKLQMFTFGSSCKSSGSRLTALYTQITCYGIKSN